VRNSSFLSGVVKRVSRKSRVMSRSPFSVSHSCHADLEDKIYTKRQSRTYETSRIKRTRNTIELIVLARMKSPKSEKWMFRALAKSRAAIPKVSVAAESSHIYTLLFQTSYRPLLSPRGETRNRRVFSVCTVGSMWDRSKGITAAIDPRSIIAAYRFRYMPDIYLRTDIR
jgi:hypothetical protein